MSESEYILVETLCIQYEVEPSFFDELSSFGLIEIHTVEDVRFIPQQRLTDLERMIRIHHELNVNLEGIDVIFNLMEKIDNLQNELKSMRNRLSLFDED